MAERDLALFDRTAFFARLRETTPARIGLARSGVSIGTADHLAFLLSHAQARDAVHDMLDVAALAGEVRARKLDVVKVASKARDRHTYLARPDFGRRLNEESRNKLATRQEGCDIAVIIADGLCARAVASHAVPLLDCLLPALTERKLTIGPIVIVQQGRVAIGDEIGDLLGAKLVCMMIGERPGLSSPDSLGIYLTSAPKIGRTDADRNCLSNIRPAGMSYDEAAMRCMWLILEARRRGMTGVTLKDESSTQIGLPRAPPNLPAS